MAEEHHREEPEIPQETITRDLTQIELKPSSDYKSVYANSVNFVMTPWDFALLFGQTAPENPRNIYIELRVIVTLSPQMAKAVAESLMQNVRNYERQFGEIRYTPLPQSSE